MKYLYSLVFSILIGFSAQAQLIINEFSQGSTGSEEFMEFVVIGTRTCTDSTADLRGWIFDDNTKEWHGNGGAAGGFLKFGMNTNWAAVPYGSIILVYNNDDKNTSITLADDPTDANNDGVYILGVNSTLFENSNGNNYTTPTATNTGTNQWTKLGLRNSGDAVVTVSPSNRNTSYHSISYGSNNNSQSTASNIRMTASGGATNYYLSNNNYSSQAAWLHGSAPTDETPGAPNTAANAAWIASLRAPVGVSGILIRDTVAICNNALPYTWRNITVNTFGDSVATFAKGLCDTTFILHLQAKLADTVRLQQNICNTQLPFTWNNQTINTVGNHTLTRTDVSAVTGCDSVTILNLQVNTAVTNLLNLDICENDLPFTWHGQTLNSIGTFTLNHITPAANGCDSLVALTVTIHHTTLDTLRINTCSENLPYVFNNTNYNTAGTYTITFTNISGCDSTIRLVLDVAPAAQDSSVYISGCDSVSHNGAWYYNDAVVRDTIFNANGCPSMIKSTYITVQKSANFYEEATVCEVDGYMFHGKLYNTSGIHTVTYTAANGCDSNYHLTLKVTPKPNLAISLDPLATYCTGDTLLIHFAGADTLTWTTQPDYLYKYRAGFIMTGGEQTFTLRGSNGGNCVNEKSVTITSANCCELGIPNAFTPNGDGLNDVFQIITPGNPRHYSMMIFDRYGTRVFYSVNATITWDGTYSNGQMGNAGVYFYILETECNGQPKVIKGDITLLP